MNHTLFFSAMLLVSLFWGLLEIQIEGAHGWAKNLPTKRFHKIKLGGGKYLTGYHLYLWLLLLSISHLPFLFIEWTLSSELYILAFFVGALSLEDFFWFVFNPAYGLKKYSKGNIPWHTKWALGLPVVMWGGIAAFVLIYYFAMITA